MGILSENGMSLLVECEDCRDKFEINSKNGTMHFKRKYEVNGQTIFLSYYDCPKCNRRHYVQIDSTKTLNEMREIEHQIIVYMYTYLYDSFMKCIRISPVHYKPTLCICPCQV